MKWVVVGKTTEEMHFHGNVEIVELGIRSKEFDTYQEAALHCAELDDERFISGQHVYYGLAIMPVKEEGDGKSS